MAVSAPTKTSDFNAGFLPPEEAGPIFDRAAHSSVAQSLAQKVPLGINGTNVPYVTGTVTANWVSEGAIKPASSAGLGLKTLSPKKLTCLVPVSAEVVRANPGGFMQLITRQVGDAFATAFDAAAFHGTNTPFTTYIDQTTNTQAITEGASNAGVYSGIVAGMAKVAADGYKVNGFAFDDVAETLFLGSYDTSSRPIFVDNPLDDYSTPVSSGKLVGRRTYLGPGVAGNSVAGYGGDWSQAAWGAIGGINYKVSTEASVTINGSLVSAFENNLVVVLAEAEYGWLVNDTDAFVAYTNVVAS